MVRNTIAISGYGAPQAIAIGGYAVRTVPAVPLVPAERPHRSGARLPPPQVVSTAGSFAFRVVLVVVQVGVIPADTPPVALTLRGAARGIIIPPGRIIMPVRAQRGLKGPSVALITPPRRARSAPVRTAVRRTPSLHPSDVPIAVASPPVRRRHAVVVVDADTYAWLCDA